jgi:hypothetical protein
MTLIIFFADCADRSDELGCSVPVIQRPPPPLITIGIGQWFNVSCTTVGQPVPEVIWRLNWGHIPSKCISSSINGVGYLACPDTQITDQGAYSCEAINVLGSTFATPDCILVVERAPSVCSTGSFNDLAEISRECLSCFCFGHTTDCSSTKLYISQVNIIVPFFFFFFFLFLFLFLYIFIVIRCHPQNSISV